MINRKMFCKSGRWRRYLGLWECVRRQLVSSAAITQSNQHWRTFHKLQLSITHTSSNQQPQCHCTPTFITVLCTHPDLIPDGRMEQGLMSHSTQNRSFRRCYLIPDETSVKLSDGSGAHLKQGSLDQHEYAFQWHLDQFSHFCTAHPHAQR